ncbi:NAD(P)/FAD-dependent oxidoreductase, partial [Chloroflexota bacterium]
TDLVMEQEAVKGVVIKNGSKLTTIPCSLVIAADGSYQQLVRLAGIGSPTLGASAAIGCEFAGVKRLDEPRDFCEVYLGDFAEGFYAGVVPYAHDRISVGLTCFPNLATQRKTLKKRLSDLISHLESIKRYDFSKASPVMMLGSGAMGAGPPPKLAADGIILVGDAAGRPALGCRWGTSGMFQAAWTAHAAGSVAVRAIKIGDVSGASLDGEYKSILAQSLKGQEVHIMEAMRTWREVIMLSPEGQDQAMKEVGGGKLRHYISI